MPGESPGYREFLKANRLRLKGVVMLSEEAAPPSGASTKSKHPYRYRNVAVG
jgi:hypothetical protein